CAPKIRPCDPRRARPLRSHTKCRAAYAACQDRRKSPAHSTTRARRRSAPASPSPSVPLRFNLPLGLAPAGFVSGVAVLAGFQILRQSAEPFRNTRVAARGIVRKRFTLSEYAMLRRARRHGAKFDQFVQRREIPPWSAPVRLLALLRPCPQCADHALRRKPSQFPEIQFQPRGLVAITLAARNRGGLQFPQSPADHGFGLRARPVQPREPASLRLWRRRTRRLRWPHAVWVSGHLPLSESSFATSHPNPSF